MISVRTPLGKREHLAVSDTSTRTLCGHGFSPGVDALRELQTLEIPENLCESCRSAYARRLRRRERYG